MSKSKGNVVYADELADRFGVDAVRYYLLSQIPFAQDGNITHESFINTYNADLANTLGNLVNRTIAMTNKYFSGKLTKPAGEAAGDPDADLLKTAGETVEKYTALMDTWHNADALDAVMTLAKRCNKYIDETAPWVLAKNEADHPRLQAVLYNLTECIRILAILLKPFLPETSGKILEQARVEEAFSGFDAVAFGAKPAYEVGTPEPLFARIDTEKVLAEIAAELETAKAAASDEKAAEQAPAENVAFLSQIGIEDFARVDLRVAKIVDCEPIKKAKKLLKLTLDDGSGTPRTVASGIAKWYTPDDLKGKSIVVVANLKPAVLCGVESQGMILAADVKAEDGSDTARVLFVDGVAPGSKIR